MTDAPLSPPSPLPFPPPHPPPLAIGFSGITEDIKIDFVEADFWLDMASSAIRTCVNIVIACVLLLVFMLVIQSIVRVAKLVMKNPKRPMPEQLARFIIALIKLILWIQVIPILVGRIGIAVDSLVAVVTAVSLTIGMSMRPHAENFVSGVALLFEKPFEVNDVVVLAGIKGRVQTIGLATTEVEEPDGNRVLIPNMKVFGAPMVNYSTTGRCRLDIDLPLLPSVSMAEVREQMLLTLGRCDVVMREPAPAVLLKEITRTALVVTARVWVESPKAFAANFSIREDLFCDLRVFVAAGDGWVAHMRGLLDSEVGCGSAKAVRAGGGDGDGDGFDVEAEKDRDALVMAVSTTAV